MIGEDSINPWPPRVHIHVCVYIHTHVLNRDVYNKHADTDTKKVTLELEGKETLWELSHTSIIYLTPSMVCSEPLSSESRPPQCMCNWFVMNTLPSEV